jgi:hypothetical protein
LERRWNRINLCISKGVIKPSSLFQHVHVVPPSIVLSIGFCWYGSVEEDG